MATAKLEAFLGLNTKQFQRALTKARADANDFAKKGLLAMGAAAVTAGTALALGTRKILAMGAELDHLRTSTGVAVKDLAVLRRAFADNGIEAGKAGSSINRMQKSLVDAGRGLKEPLDALDMMGLSIDEVAGRGPIEQFKILANRIGAIEDPAKRTAAAMAIFGKAGAGLQTIFTNSTAIDDAAASLGRMPEILDRMSVAFERVDTLIGRLPDKANQFFTGFASEIVGSILGPLEEVNKLDFTELGQRLGEAIRPFIEGIRSGDTWKLFGLYGVQAVAGFVGDMIDAGQEIGRVIVASLQAAFDVASDFFSKTMLRAVAEVQADLYDMIAKLPFQGIYKDLAAKTREFAANRGEARSFGDAFAERFAPTQSNEIGSKFRAAWQPEIDALAGKMKDLGDRNTAAAAAMGGTANAAANLANAIDAPSTGATAAVKTMASAALSFAQKMGFSTGDAASGSRGGGVLSQRAREAQRIGADAERLFDQSARYSALGNTEEAGRYFTAAQRRQAQADAIRIPGANDRGTMQDPGPAGAAGAGASGGGGGDAKNADLVTELRNLVSALRTIGGKLGVI